MECYQNGPHAKMQIFSFHATIHTSASLPSKTHLFKVALIQNTSFCKTMHTISPSASLSPTEQDHSMEEVSSYALSSIDSSNSEDLPLTNSLTLNNPTPANLTLLPGVCSDLAFKDNASPSTPEDSDLPMTSGATMKTMNTLPSVKAPLLPSHLNPESRYDVLYSPEYSVELYDHLLSIISETKATVLKQSKKEHSWKIVALFQPTFMTGLSTITIHFYVYTVLCNGVELSAFHMMKTCGNSFEYHKIYKYFLKAFTIEKKEKEEQLFQESKGSVEQETIELLP